MLLLKYWISEEISMRYPSGNISTENDGFKSTVYNTIKINALCSVSLPAAGFHCSSLFGNISG